MSPEFLSSSIHEAHM